MRAWTLTAPGSFDHLEIADVPAPAPGPGELRIRVEAVGLNPVDAWLALGDGDPAWTWPHVPGLDVAGVIDAIGADVSGFAVGDRVANHGDLRRPGCLADLVVADARTVARVPEGVDAIAAAALPCAGMTAYQAVVRRLRLDAEQTVLVTAAAGGVGGFAVQLAALAGARVIGTASAANHDRVRVLGASDVVDYRNEDVAARVRALTDGRGVDGVVDTLGGDSATANLGLLAFGGGIACIAGHADLSAIESFTIAPSIHDIALGAAHAHGDARAVRHLATDLEALLALVADGRLDPMVERVLAFDELPAGLADLAGRHVRGKLVVALG
ncbi:MAG: zinc-binding dehydrogenase [Propionicimonas sp.]|uniref:zinc-binding dehydrogenase n=1 Tax=Propionicimonas sp. TaxID=1955623 RepID=UPI003D108672